MPAGERLAPEIVRLAFIASPGGGGLISGVKITDEPVPQKLEDGIELAEIITGSNMSVKLILVAADVVLVLLIVNSRVTVSPALTGSFRNCLFSNGTGCTKSLSEAGGKKENIDSPPLIPAASNGASPSPMSAASEEVVFV